MRYFPLREMGYSIAFMVVLAAIYAGAYYATVDRVPAISFGNETEGFRWVVPSYSIPKMADFFDPMHEVDRRLRPAYWSDKEAALDEFDKFLAKVRK